MNFDPSNLRLSRLPVERCSLPPPHRGAVTKNGAHLSVHVLDQTDLVPLAVL